jgi:hypothetical protein
MNVNKDSLISNKSTTAHTNYQGQEEFPNPDSDGDEHLCAAAPRTIFNINNETGKRGAKPESNQIRDNEATMIHQKKEKCLELFRNNGDIRDMIISRESNPQGHDLSAVIEMLYQSKHFQNRKFSYPSQIYSYSLGGPLRQKGLKQQNREIFCPASEAKASLDFSGPANSIEL